MNCTVKQAAETVAKARKTAYAIDVMCRDGLTQVARIIELIEQNKGRQEDIALLKELCGVIAATADCEGSVQCAEILSGSLEKNADEWASHVVRRRCPSGECAAFPKETAVPPAGEIRLRRRTK